MSRTTADAAMLPPSPFVITCVGPGAWTARQAAIACTLVRSLAHGVLVALDHSTPEIPPLAAAGTAAGIGAVAWIMSGVPVGLDHDDVARFDLLLAR